MTTSASHRVNPHHNITVRPVDKDSCELTARSPLSGQFNTLTFPYGSVVMNRLIRSWLTSNTLIQNAFPNLSADHREFLMTGISPADWDTYIVRDDEAGDEKEI